MKTLGRILTIVLALGIVMGVLYVSVNATASAAPAQNARFERGQRPEFPDRDRGERFERGGFGWIFGAIKNIVVIAIIVTAIVIPKRWLQRRKRQLQINGA